MCDTGSFSTSPFKTIGDGDAENLSMRYFAAVNRYSMVAVTVHTGGEATHIPDF